jgi:hypothetical protein
VRPKLHDRLPNLAGIEATVVAMRQRVKGTRPGQVVRTGRGAMPGHTPGTISLIFEVKDNGKPLTVAFPGGTEFNFVNDVAHSTPTSVLRANLPPRRRPPAPPF